MDTDKTDAGTARMIMTASLARMPELPEGTPPEVRRHRARQIVAETMANYTAVSQVIVEVLNAYAKTVVPSEEDNHG